jgi:hypothetical protein
MSWERIVKKDKDQWLDLSEVILGEFDYEVWKDKPIPEELTALKQDFDKLDEDGKDAIEQLLEIGLEETDENRKQIFALITAVIGVN